MSKLEQLLNEKYGANLSEKDCKDASRNLVGFFQELLKIDARLQSEASSHEKAQSSVSNVIKPRTKNQCKTKSNNSQNENNRGTN
jgi:hypothetical protein